MSEYDGLPSIPGYVSIKEAASFLGISEKTVYFYVEKRRLPAMWAADVLMIALDDLKKFKLQPVGRPRKSTPLWRVSTGENTQFMLFISVQVRIEQGNALERKVEQMRRNSTYLFPGTVARSISRSETNPGQVMIVLIWKKSIMPDEVNRQEELEALKRELSDELDWSTAQYNESTVLIHT